MFYKNSQLRKRGIVSRSADDAAPTELDDLLGYVSTNMPPLTGLPSASRYKNPSVWGGNLTVTQ